MRVTHPFHPLHGQELELVQACRGWHEERVCLQREDGQLTWLSRRWTSLATVDPFVELSAGRALLRVQDALELAALLQGLQGAECSPTERDDV